MVYSFYIKKKQRCCTMSEEMKEPMQTDNDCKTEEAAASTTETMADYEDHFDDANPWNLVTKYMEEKTVLPVKVEIISFTAQLVPILLTL